MNDAITVTGAVIAGRAIEKLLFTHSLPDSSPERETAHDTITEQAEYAYEFVYHLSGGAASRDAQAVGVTNLLHCTAPMIVSFALHHLGQLLPDLTHAQWDRLNAAGAVLSLRVREDLTGANAISAPDKSPQSRVRLSGLEAGVSGELC